MGLCRFVREPLAERLPADPIRRTPLRPVLGNRLDTITDVSVLNRAPDTLGVDAHDYISFRLSGAAIRSWGISGWE